MILLISVATRSVFVFPSFDFTIDSSIREAVSRAACAQRWARLRTSSATTAKPMPASPARAASTAAFSARMFVWNAISSITRMIFAILPLEALMSANRPDHLLEGRIGTVEALLRFDHQRCRIVAVARVLLRHRVDFFTGCRRLLKRRRRSEDPCASDWLALETRCARRWRSASAPWASSFTAPISTRLMRCGPCRLLATTPEAIAISSRMIWHRRAAASMRGSAAAAPSSTPFRRFSSTSAVTAAIDAFCRGCATFRYFARASSVFPSRLSGYT